MLRQNDLVSLGAHVYSGQFNSASVIGRFGNPYNDYLNAFSLDSTLVKEGLNLIPVTNVIAGATCPNCKAQMKCPNCKQIAPAPALGPAFSPKASYPTNYSKPSGTQNSNANRLRKASGARGGRVEDEEGLFLDIMKGAASVTGALEGPLGALASVAINAASKLAESTNAESTLDPSTLHEGTVERAVLAEAALTAVQQMNLHPDKEEGIFSDIKDFFVKAAPTIRSVAPKVLDTMMEPALKIAMNSLQDYNQKNAQGGQGTEGFYGFEPAPRPAIPHVTYPVQIPQIGDRNAQAFAQGLQNALRASQESYGGESEEGFFDFVKSGLGYVGQGLSVAAKVGLPILMQHLGGAESLDAEAADTDSAVDMPGALSKDALAKRAIAGEAALQALMKLPPHRLEEEGFFDTIAGVIKSIAPVVIKVAPAVISKISPTVGSIIKAATGQEASFASAASAAYPPPQAPRPSLGKKLSTMGLRTRDNTSEIPLGFARGY